MNNLPIEAKIKIAKDIKKLNKDFSYLKLTKELYLENGLIRVFIFIVLFPFIYIWVEHSNYVVKKFKKENSEFFI